MISLLYHPPLSIPHMTARPLFHDFASNVLTVSCGLLEEGYTIDWHEKGCTSVLHPASERVDIVTENGYNDLYM